MKNLKESLNKIDLTKFQLNRYYFIFFILFLFGFALPKYFIQIPLHYSGNTPTSYMFFITCTFILFAWKIIIVKTKNSKDTKTDKLDWIFLIPTTISLGSFILIQYSLPKINNSFTLSYVLWTWLLYLCFLTTFLLGRETIRNNIKLFFTFIGSIIFYFTFTNFIWNNWLYISKAITPIIVLVLTPFTTNANYTISNLPAELIPMPLISADNFAVYIGLSCSGIESISLFVSLFLLLSLYYINEIKKTNFVIILFFGIIGAILINILRISALILIGTKYPVFALGHFHTNAGWLFFTIYVLVYYHFAQKYFLK